MIRGEVWRVNLEPATPPEFGKCRPALIVSNSLHNAALATVVVIPLSSRPPVIWPLRVEVEAIAGLPKKSFAVVPGIRQVDKARFEQCLGAISVDNLKRIDEALAAYLSDP